MNNPALMSLYSVAASISTPLALGAFVCALFFGISKKVIQSLGPAIARIAGKKAFIVLMTILSYGFVLSVIGLVGAFGGFAVQFGLKEYAEKQSLREAAQQSIANREADSAILSSSKFIEKWPEEPTGYSYRGTAYFQRQSYADAIADFRKADALIGSTRSDCTDDNIRSKASLAATLGASGDFKEGYDVSSRVIACKLEKPMRFNHAKLSIQNGNFKEASDILSSSDMLSAVRPDLRPQVHAARATLAMTQKVEGWENAATMEV
jgi:tetratricopeptide (TPR) repeat protein